MKRVINSTQTHSLPSIKLHSLQSQYPHSRYFSSQPSYYFGMKKFQINVENLKIKRRKLKCREENMTNLIQFRRYCVEIKKVGDLTTNKIKVNNENEEKNKKNNKFNLIVKQRQFMDKLYQKLGLKSFEEWYILSKYKMEENNGRYLLEYYYDNQFFKLFSTLYPYYPWHPSLFKTYKFRTKKNTPKIDQQINNNEIDMKRKTIKKSYFQSKENQQEFIIKLYHKMKCKSMDDFAKISKKNIIDNGGKNLLHHFSDNRKKLIQSIFPNFPWQSIPVYGNIPISYPTKLLYFRSIENQRKFMDDLYLHLELLSFDHLAVITKKEIIENGGKTLIVETYARDQKRLLRTVYPNYPWDFQMKFGSELFFEGIDNQRLFIDHLFIKLKMKKMEEWIDVEQDTIYLHGGRKLLEKYYANDIKRMLQSLYPHKDWDLIHQQRIVRLHQKTLQSIAAKLNIKSDGDWIKITRNQIVRNGGKKLLDYYGNDLQTLLRSLIPNHSFPSYEIRQKFRPNSAYFRSNLSFNANKLKLIQSRFLIHRKRDWYRLPIIYQEINVYRSLKLIFADHHWNKKLFQIRSKKYHQRILFAELSELFQRSFLILENYRHPKLQFTISMEIDVFIPSLNIAFEYQGDHHYNDMPKGFNPIELYQLRDQWKLHLSQQNQIRLIAIPYWWNFSPSSLSSSIRSFLQLPL